MASLKLTTAKIKGETEQEYWAWFLFCSTRNIEDLVRVWELIRTDRWQGELTEELKIKIRSLGNLPSERQLYRWASKYYWAERKEQKIQEEIEELQKRSKKFSQQKKDKIIIGVGRLIDDFFRKTESRKLTFDNLSVSDFKKLWEMARTELGESIGNHDFKIKEEDQQPPTESEMAEIENMSRTFKKLYESRAGGQPRKKDGDVLDMEK